MILTRRNALRSLFIAAPAIVAAPSLMRVSAKLLMPETRGIAISTLQAFTPDSPYTFEITYGAIGLKPGDLVTLSGADGMPSQDFRVVYTTTSKS